MKIYTRTGDSGDTALFGGGRVAKDHPRVVAYGTVDELNAFLGAALGTTAVSASRARLSHVQHDLFAIGAHLSAPPAREGRKRPELPPLPERRIRAMEKWIDSAEEQLAPLRAFILPGGAAGARDLHVCRTVCRRAERAVIALADGDPSVSFSIQYLNRLSDLLFVLARLENHTAGVEDVPWEKEG